MIDSIIFDLDGTLWDATYANWESWNNAIKEAGYDFTLTHEQVVSTMGFSVEDMAAIVFPHITDLKERMELMYRCFDAEEANLAVKGGILMEGLEEVLTELKKNYRLFIVSNCQDGYVQVFLEAHKMWDYFEGFICAGDTGMTKGQNNLILMKDYDLKAPIYVGDTKGDHNSAIEAGIPYVHCTFGFGNTENPDYSINSLKELIDLCKEI